MDTRHILSGSSFNKLPLKLRNDRRSTRTDKRGNARRDNLSFFHRNSFTSSGIKFYEREGEKRWRRREEEKEK